jgi:hypothetical protein
VIEMMIQTEKAFSYRGFGYNILSDIKLPELLAAKELEDQVDIIIEREDLNQIWSQLAGPDDYFVMEEKRILFRVPDAGLFSIEEGKKIVVSPNEGSDEGEIRLYILGTCMGAILIQRKVFPLHGSAIAINGKAYVFVGDSGAGKSTLASAFINKGYEMLSDDVIAVSFSNENVPFVTPSYPQQKLWQESLNEFGMESEDFQPLYGRETKYSVPVASRFSNERLPLSGIFELVITENEKIRIQPISGLERLHTLFRHTYRNHFLKPLGLMDWHFNNSTKIINYMPLYQLQRSNSSFTAPELVSLVLKTINEECK